MRRRSLRSPRPPHLDEVHAGFQLRVDQEIAVHTAGVALGNYLTLLRDQLALRVALARGLYMQPSRFRQRNAEDYRRYTGVISAPRMENGLKQMRHHSFIHRLLRKILS